MTQGTKKEYVEECVVKEHLVKEHINIDNMPDECLKPENTGPCRLEMDCDEDDPTCISMAEPDVYVDLFSGEKDTDWNLVDTCAKSEDAIIGKLDALPAYLDALPEFAVTTKSPKRRRY